MSLLDNNGNPIQPKLDQQQVVQLMTGLRIRIDAANAQLVQLGLLVEYLYENLSEKHNIDIEMEGFPVWAEARYKEIQAQAEAAMKDAKDTKDSVASAIKEEAESMGINLDEDSPTTTTTTETETTNDEE